MTLEEMQAIFVPAIQKFVNARQGMLTPVEEARSVVRLDDILHMLFMSCAGFDKRIKRKEESDRAGQGYNEYLLQQKALKQQEQKARDLRDAAIWRACKQGKSYKEIAVEFRVSVEIVRRVSFKADREIQQFIKTDRMTEFVRVALDGAMLEFGGNNKLTSIKFPEIP